MRGEWIKGCLLAALFLGPAQAQQPEPIRPDIVACVRAVDGLDDLMRDKMQGHCLVIAGNICEASPSGPILACLQDMTADMKAYVDGALTRMPDSIDANGLRQRSYARTLERLRSPDAGKHRCEMNHSRAFDRTLCLATAAFARLTDVFVAARYAGVNLP